MRTGDRRTRVRQPVSALQPLGARIARYLGVGLAITVALEALKVDVLRRWSYSPATPRVFAIGLASLLQWIVVPLVVLWLARRYQVPGAALNR